MLSHDESSATDTQNRGEGDTILAVGAGALCHRHFAHTRGCRQWRERSFRAHDFPSPYTLVLFPCKLSRAKQQILYQQKWCSFCRAFLGMMVFQEGQEALVIGYVKKKCLWWLDAVFRVNSSQVWVRRHYQSFGIITITAVLDKVEDLLWSGCIDIGVVIAMKWRHYLGTL